MNSRTVRIGFIGTGDMAVTHLREMINGNMLESEYDIAGIADTSTARIDEFERIGRFHVKRYSSAAELSNASDIDAIFICSPNSTHLEHAVGALNSGKHVFLEKPMSLTLEECDKIIAARNKTGRILQIGLVYRYSPLFREMAKIVADGKIGQPVMGWCHEFRVPFPVGKGREWRYSQAKSGGSLVEKNCHHFDVLEWIIGSSAVRVFASGGQAVVNSAGPVSPGVPGEPYIFDKSSANDIIDHAWVIVDYRNGAKSSLGLSLFAANRTLPVGVIGTKGWMEACVQTEMITLYTGTAGHLENIQPRRKAHELADSGHSGGLRQLKEFHASVLTGALPFASGEVGRQSLVCAIAAEQSIISGKPVMLDVNGEVLDE